MADVEPEADAPPEDAPQDEADNEEEAGAAEEQQQPGPPPLPSTLVEGWTKGYFVTRDLECEGGAQLRCLNEEAVWRISGAKPGNGVESLLDNDVSETERKRVCGFLGRAAVG